MIVAFLRGVSRNWVFQGSRWDANLLEILAFFSKVLWRCVVAARMGKLGVFFSCAWGRLRLDEVKSCMAMNTLTMWIVDMSDIQCVLFW